MSDEKPDPLSDVIKGLGLILRAAKTTVERMPKKGLEDAVLETAREVGRAIENVAGAVEREVLGRKGAPGSRASSDRDKDAARGGTDSGDAGGKAGKTGKAGEAEDVPPSKPPDAQ